MIRIENVAQPSMPPKLDKKTEKPAVRVQLVTSDEWLAKIADWRRQQPDMPNLSEAIRRLVELGLEKSGSHKRG